MTTAILDTPTVRVKRDKWEKIDRAALDLVMAINDALVDDPNIRYVLCFNEQGCEKFGFQDAFGDDVAVQPVKVD